MHAHDRRCRRAARGAAEARAETERGRDCCHGRRAGDAEAHHHVHHAGPGWHHEPGMAWGRRGEARRYLEPSLLLLLAEKEAHGYELMERLGEVFPRASALPDVSTLYRMLAALEEEGALASRWEGGEGGGRKVYRLTDQGKELLSAWAAAFRDEHSRLGRFLERFGRTAESQEERG